MKRKTKSILVASAATLLTGLIPAQAALVAHYEFENNGNDSGIAPANTMTLQGDAGYSTQSAPNNGGTASLNLDGTGAYASSPDEDSLDIITNLTLAIWIRPTSFSNSGAGILSKFLGADSQNQRSYGLRLANNNTDGSANNNVRFFTTTNGAFSSASIADSTFELAQDTWTHVAATFDEGELRIYINGQASGQNLSGGSTIHSGSAPLWVGAQFDASNNNNLFIGQLDDARVYNETLTQTQIAALVPEPTSAVLLSVAACLTLARRRR